MPEDSSLQDGVVPRGNDWGNIGSAIEPVQKIIKNNAKSNIFGSGFVQSFSASLQPTEGGIESLTVSKFCRVGIGWDRTKMEWIGHIKFRMSPSTVFKFVTKADLVVASEIVRVEILHWLMVSSENILGI